MKGKLVSDARLILTKTFGNITLCLFELDDQKLIGFGDYFWWDFSIEELKLHHLLEGALKGLGLNNLSDLFWVHLESLCEKEGIGDKSIDDLRVILHLFFLREEEILKRLGKIKGSVDYLSGDIRSSFYGAKEAIKTDRIFLHKGQRVPDSFIADFDLPFMLVHKFRTWNIYSVRDLALLGLDVFRDNSYLTKEELELIENTLMARLEPVIGREISKECSKEVHENNDELEKLEEIKLIGEDVLKDKKRKEELESISAPKADEPSIGKLRLFKLITKEFDGFSLDLYRYGGVRVLRYKELYLSDMDLEDLGLKDRYLMAMADLGIKSLADFVEKDADGILKEDRYLGRHIDKITASLHLFLERESIRKNEESYEGLLLDFIVCDISGEMSSEKEIYKYIKLETDSSQSIENLSIDRALRHSLNDLAISSLDQLRKTDIDFILTNGYLTTEEVFELKKALNQLESQREKKRITSVVRKSLSSSVGKKEGFKKEDKVIPLERNYPKAEDEETDRAYEDLLENSNDMFENPMTETVAGDRGVINDEEQLSDSIEENSEDISEGIEETKTEEVDSEKDFERECVQPNNPEEIVDDSQVQEIDEVEESTLLFTRKVEGQDVGVYKLGDKKIIGYRGIFFDDINIKELGLSARPFNALVRNRKNTLISVLEFSDDELMNIRNLGKKSRDEIYENTLRHLDYLLIDRAGFCTDLVVNKQQLKNYTEENSEDIKESALLFTRKVEGQKIGVYRFGDKKFIGYRGMFFDDIDILELNLSVRPFNALKNSDKNTLISILELTEDELIKIRNIGKKSLDEIYENTLRLLDYRIIDGDGFSTDLVVKIQQLINYEVEETKNGNDTFVFNHMRYKDYRINELGLSKRSENGLKRNGINLLSELLKVDSEEILSFRNIGKKSLEEINQIRDEYVNSLTPVIEDDSKLSMEEHVEIAFYLKTIEEKIGYGYSKNLRYVLEDVFKSLSDEERAQADKSELIYRKDVIYNLLNNHLMEILEGDFIGLTEEELLERFPENLPYSIFRGMVLDLIKEGKIKKESGKYFMVYPSFLEVLNSSDLDEEKKNIIKWRMEGQTLEEIGSKVGVTRERIRQIESKTLRNLGLGVAKNRLQKAIDEDRYGYFYEKYFVNKEFFGDTLPNYPELPYFLNQRYKKGTGELSDAVDDPIIPTDIRKRLQKWLDKDYLIIGEHRIKKEKIAIENYLLSRYCRDEKHIKEFLELYDEFIKEHDLVDLIGLSDENSRSNAERIYRRDNVLRKPGKLLRYYDYQGTDTSELLEVLDLEQYENCELSTLKLFKTHKNLMDSYDVRDEYELFSLLKEIHDENPISDSIIFKRNPSLEFGTYNRDEYVVEKYRENYPISKADLARLISEETGHQVASIYGSWFIILDEISIRGVLNDSSKIISDEDISRLEALLTKDFYRIEEVRRIYRKINPSSDKSDLNAVAFNKLGFDFYSGYILRNTYETTRAYVREVLLTDDIVDISGISHYFSHLPTFSSTLYNFRGDYEIIEFEPYKYVNIRRFESLGYGKMDMVRFCNQVYDFTTDGQFFTLRSLRDDGFTSDIDELGFDDYFYSSLLREDDRFAYQRMGGRKVFKKGQGPIVRSDLFEYILDAYGSMDIDDFRNYLLDTFGIRQDKDQVKSAISNSDIYYDGIMDKIYKNYGLYYEEI